MTTATATPRRKLNITRMIYTCLQTPGFNGRWGVPLNLISAPAAAKTSKVNQLGKAAGMGVTTLLTALMDPSDAQGLPVFSTAPNGRQVTSYAAPAWAAALEAGTVDTDQIVFLDEISNASGAVQAAFLRVVFEGVVGEMDLDPRVRFIMAMNPPEMSPNGYPLAAPLANRMIHVNCPDPSVTGWGAWMLATAGATPAEVAAACGGEVANEIDAVKVKTNGEVLALWGDAFKASTRLVFSFLKVRPDLIAERDLNAEPHNPRNNGAWASPRTWEAVARVLAGARIHGCTQSEIAELIEGTVGVAIAAEFLNYAATADLPNPVEVLASPGTFPIPTDRPDVIQNTVNALLRHCMPVAPGQPGAREAARDDLAGALFTYLRRVEGAGFATLFTGYLGHLKACHVWNREAQDLQLKIAADIQGAR